MKLVLFAVSFKKNHLSKCSVYLRKEKAEGKAPKQQKNFFHG